ncbi:MAG: FliM/FliN family flagellar motor switch protein [Gammaproteobacteria bacterium]|nr:FliM/FliN family flagellar motor switch protein [Gammaproteobacteria bacterium]MDH3429826.1 FliM/FliN family flagellar motor switch protein [Gammaproteobacteria bacterium]MDH3433734.1 FliM/FliN family flagellar motor switch protein [Gammaproteobacteria bacterium]
MTDQVLTDDEKEALLDGVATGEVEIQSKSGPAYAAVRPFEIAERCRLKSNSYPRLQRLNQRVALRVGKLVEQLVSAETEITPNAVETCPYAEFIERDSNLSLMVEFSAKPLEGSGLIVLNAALVGHLVEAFYGGSENESTRPAIEFFTRGEISVASLFGDHVMKTVAEVWRPIIDTEHQQVTTHLNTDLIEGFDASDRVIWADFDISFLKQQQSFQIVWPVSMLAPVLPVFEGQKRERDAAQDALWERSLRSRLTDSVVGISSRVGNSEMTLGAVAELSPGDVIDIDNPRLSTVFVKQVPILQGRFGVHDGRYAVEATNWLAPDSRNRA